MAVISAPSVFAQQPRDNSIKEERNLIKDGNKAYREGNYAKALQCYDEASARSSDVGGRSIQSAPWLLPILPNPADSTSKTLDQAIEIYQRLGKAAADKNVA